MTLRGQSEHPVSSVTYHKIDAAEVLDDGSLRLYRRRGPFGLLRRQDVFHPKGAWRAITLNDQGTCIVALGWSL